MGSVQWYDLPHHDGSPTYLPQPPQHLGDTFDPDPKERAIYDGLYHEVYLKMYKRLRPLYEKIRSITGYPPCPAAESAPAPASDAASGSSGKSRRSRGFRIEPPRRSLGLGVLGGLPTSRRLDDASMTCRTRKGTFEVPLCLRVFVVATWAGGRIPNSEFTIPNLDPRSSASSAVFCSAFPTALSGADADAGEDSDAG